MKSGTRIFRLHLKAETLLEKLVKLTHMTHPSTTVWCSVVTVVIISAEWYGHKHCMDNSAILLRE